MFTKKCRRRFTSSFASWRMMKRMSGQSCSLLWSTCSTTRQGLMGIRPEIWSVLGRWVWSWRRTCSKRACSSSLSRNGHEGSLISFPSCPKRLLSTGTQLALRELSWLIATGGTLSSPLVIGWSGSLPKPGQRGRVACHGSAVCPALGLLLRFGGLAFFFARLMTPAHVLLRRTRKIASLCLKTWKILSLARSWRSRSLRRVKHLP